MRSSVPEHLRPKHLLPDDLPFPFRSGKIRGYLPAPPAPEDDSGFSNSASSRVRTGPDDWNGPSGQSGMTADELAEEAIRKGPHVVFENIEVLARASEAKYQEVREKLKQTTDVNLNGLAAARREAAERLEEEKRKADKQKKRRAFEDEDVPFVQVNANRPSREVVDEACSAVKEFNDPPEIFRRGREIVRVKIPEDGRPAFEDVNKAGFDDLLSRSANFAEETEDGFKHTDLPRRLTSRVRARVEIPQLKAVSQVPVLRPDGSVFRGPGYDEETKVLCRPEGDVPPVPESPTGHELRRATKLLSEPFCDFPFVDQASRANLLAAVLTPVLRPLLSGANVPLFIFDATKQGTGKTLLADAVGLVSTGQVPAKMSAPAGEAEWRKQVTAQLRRGQPIVTVDNVKGRISSSALERALTSETFGDRLLGQSRQLDLPADVLWIATGNNLRPEGEMTRRSVLVRMDAGMVRPWERSGFEHPNLREWIRARRGTLVAAGLTLVRAWIDAGRPTPSEGQLGSFERWAEVAGGVLGHAGIEGFLENLEELHGTAGGEERRWSRLLKAIRAWARQKEGAPKKNTDSPAVFTAKELAGDLKSAGSSRGDGPPGSANGPVGKIKEALPEELQARLRDGNPIARSLGKRFGNRRGQRFPGGWYVRREGRGRQGTRWAVCKGEPSASSGGDSSNGRSSTSPSGEGIRPSGSPTSDRSPGDRSPSGSPAGDGPSSSRAPADRSSTDQSPASGSP